MHKFTPPQINGTKLILFLPPQVTTATGTGISISKLCSCKERHHVIALLSNNNPAVLVAVNKIPPFVKQGYTPIQAIASLITPNLGKVRDCLLNSPPHHLCPFGHPAQQHSLVVLALLGLKQKPRTSAVSVSHHCIWTSTLAPGPPLLCATVQGGQKGNRWGRGEISRYGN